MTELEQQKLSDKRELMNRNLEQSKKLREEGSTPEHYKLPITPQEYADANRLFFDEGNVIKYISRHAKKNGREDVMKAIHYCLFILERDYQIDGTAAFHDREGNLINILEARTNGNK